MFCYWKLLAVFASLFHESVLSLHKCALYIFGLFKVIFLLLTCNLWSLHLFNLTVHRSTTAALPTLLWFKNKMLSLLSYSSTKLPFQIKLSWFTTKCDPIDEVTWRRYEAFCINTVHMDLFGLEMKTVALASNTLNWLFSDFCISTYDSSSTAFGGNQRKL